MKSSSLTTLGTFAFSVNGSVSRGPATRKARALMAYLVMSRGADCGRERLLEVFWPDVNPDRARDSLSTALHSIRRCLRALDADPDEFLIANKSVVRWAAETSLDALRFTGLAIQTEAAADKKAVELYRGDFLEGDFDDWTLSERERLSSLYESALSRLVRSSKDVETARRFIERNPYDEDAYAVLVEADLSSGRRSSALTWIERCREALAEVGEAPSTTFAARFADVLPIPVSTTQELTLPFVGRQSELSTLLAKLVDAPEHAGSVTLVHGAAGIGKSTLLDRFRQIATQRGFRVLTMPAAQNQNGATFGAWSELFSEVVAEDFNDFVKGHASHLAVAVADRIFSRLSPRSVFVIDDAHELTGEALDILLAAFECFGSSVPMVVGLRPEGLSILRSRALENRYEEIALDRLDRSDLNWALTRALGNAQLQLLDVLYDRTAGHPLFFLSLLNSLVDAGVLARENGRWRLITSIVREVELPDSIKHFIETRLRERGEAPRAVACALGIEPTANAEDLSAALGFDEPTTLDAIDDLLALAVIAQPPTGPQFAFTHDLIREVASVELNAGRRAALHRRFADRLEASGLAGISLRLARHLEAAGESMSAAHAYLKSAQEALEYNAALDATDRCNLGIRAVERLERSPERDALLAVLHRTAARAAIAGGDVTAAISRARESATLVRATSDARELARAALDLAMMDAAALGPEDQECDADLAIAAARSCADPTLEAQALIQRAAAARELGLRKDADAHARTAAAIAQRYGLSSILSVALQELARAQMTWWQFKDAAETLRVVRDAVRFEEPFVEASFLHTRCELSYLLGRFDDATADIDEALRITSEAIPRRTTSAVTVVHPQSTVQFACHYMSAKLATVRDSFDAAIKACDKAAALTNIARLPRYGEALALLRIDALLGRNGSSDNLEADSIIAGLVRPTRSQGTFGWSDCVELARARVAARLKTADADIQLRDALDMLEENAHRALLDTDFAFSRLAETASTVSNGAVAVRAHLRCEHYQTERRAAAAIAYVI